jgi:hypothetical protein
MTDVVGSKGAINSCTHNSAFNSDREYVAPLEWQAIGNPSLGSNGTVKLKQVGNANTYYADQNMSHATLSNGAAIAASRIPGFGREALSGLNSIYELKDLVSAFQNVPAHILWAAFRGQYAKSGKLARDWAKAQLGKPPLQILKDLVGLDLAWKFGWKPLIEDIQKVHSALGRQDSNMQRLLTKMFSSAGTYSSQTSSSSAPFTGASDGDPYGTSTAACRIIKTTKRVDVAGVRRTLAPNVFAHPDLARLAAVRESLGLTLGARDVWMAMRLSFVVDWIIPIGDFIEQFALHPPNSSWFVTHSTWTSAKTTTTGDVIYTRSPVVTNNNTVIGLPQERRTSFRKSTYVRTAGGVSSPTPLFLPQFRLPQVGQIWTGMELALQRMVK